MEVEAIMKQKKKRTNYERGRDFEYRVMEYLEGLGMYCMRSAGSHGIFDIIAVPLAWPISQEDWFPGPLLIQAKKDGKIPKEEYKILKKNETRWNAQVLTVRNGPKRKLVFETISTKEKVELEK